MRLQYLTAEHLQAILSLEEEVLARLERADLLRRNTPEMWATCLLPPHLTVGLFSDEGELAAVAVLFVPQRGSGEDLSASLGEQTAVQCRQLSAHSPEVEIRSANYKICMVHPRWRGNGYQLMLGRRLEEEAVRRGVGLLCATVSPYNTASIRNLQHLGYRYDRTLPKYGYDRQLWYKPLSQQSDAEL